MNFLSELRWIHGINGCFLYRAGEEERYLNQLSNHNGLAVVFESTTITFEPGGNKSEEYQVFLNVALPLITEGLLTPPDPDVILVDHESYA